MFKVLKISVICLVFFTVGCDVDVYVEEPERPTSIPETSLWVGGPDGGVFVLITSPDKLNNNMYHAEIYYVSGDTAYKGFMRIHPANSGDIDLTKKESFSFWDGDNLYLRDGRYLKVQE